MHTHRELKVGFIGWRGMVGSVLLSRIQKENDFTKHKLYFFSTSQAGKSLIDLSGKSCVLLDAYAIQDLLKMDVIVTCQGSEYTSKIHPKLRQQNWRGYWIDAASNLRMEKSSIIVLSPINQTVIDSALNKGIRDFIGGNCTVSLLLMAIGKLLKEDLVKWISVMSYQAYSGAGAKALQTFVQHMQTLVKDLDLVANESSILTTLDLDAHITRIMQHEKFLKNDFGIPLVANLLPWIDTAVNNTGQTREEWKAAAEANKILQTTDQPIPIDGICVRVGTMRCHSQALTVQLKSKLTLNELESMIKETTPWTRVIPNTQEETRLHLTPVNVAGKLDIHVGRIRQLNFGENIFSIFTVGDQLLWGAAEPLRLALCSIMQFLEK